MSPAAAAVAVVLQEEKSISTFFKPLDSEESLQFKFTSKCYACGKFGFYVISPSSWTPCDIHGGYVMIGATKLMLKSRRFSTECASHVISGAQAVSGTGPQRRGR